MRQLRRIWLDNWDTALIWCSVMVLALLAGGALSATVEAVRHATTYH